MKLTVRTIEQIQRLYQKEVKDIVEVKPRHFQTIHSGHNTKNFENIASLIFSIFGT